MLILAQGTARPAFPPLHHLRPLSAPCPADLVARARRALEHEPQLARHYLDQLAGMFSTVEEPTANPAIILAARPSVDPVGGPIKGGLASWQLRRVLQHIDERLNDPIVIETLAEVAQLSSGHFCRAFKVTIGETAHSFLIRQRIRRAQLLMLNTRDTLSEISYACGLSDQAHLTRLFRRMVGQTPLIWRRTWQAPR